MAKAITAIPDTKEGIRMLLEVVRNMFQEDIDGKDEGGVYEIKYGDHMFFVPKRIDNGVEAMMAIDKICCRGFSFKRKRKKLIGFIDGRGNRGQLFKLSVGHNNYKSVRGARNPVHVWYTRA